VLAGLAAAVEPPLGRSFAKYDEPNCRTNRIQDRRTSQTAAEVTGRGCSKCVSQHRSLDLVGTSETTTSDVAAAQASGDGAAQRALRECE
jgi:hypothetical protein